MTFRDRYQKKCRSKAHKHDDTDFGQNYLNIFQAKTAGANTRGVRTAEIHTRLPFCGLPGRFWTINYPGLGEWGQQLHRIKIPRANTPAAKKVFLTVIRCS